MPPVAPEQAAIAETCRHFIDAYASFVHTFKPPQHHQVWYRKLSAIFNGSAEKRNLLVVAPPGSGKSWAMSMVWPCWYMGHHPDHHLLFLTSSDEMSHKYASVVRLCLEQNERHQLVFPSASARPDSGRGWSNDGLYLAGMPQWAKDPTYKAIGWGQTTIGARAHGIIIDDPLSQPDAVSPIEQQKAKDYFDMTLDNRLKPDTGWVIAIMTRWHESDLAAHLLSKLDFDVLHMPALGNDPGGQQYPWGRSIWPGYFSEEFYENKRRVLGGPVFECVFQGDPTAMGGNVFRKREWFRPLPSDFDQVGADGKSARERLTVVQYWDLAFSSKTSADYTACVTVGVDRKGRCYVLNVWRGRAQLLADYLEDNKSGLGATMAGHVARQVPALVGIEHNNYRSAAIKALVNRVNRLLAQMHASSRVQAIKVANDKVTRAYLPAAVAEAGDLFVDRDAPWFEEFVAELMGFPNMANDDQVDALSGAIQMAMEHVDLEARQDGHYSVRAAPGDPGWDPFAEAEDAFYEAEMAEAERVVEDEEGSRFANPTFA